MPSSPVPFVRFRLPRPVSHSLKQSTERDGHLPASSIKLRLIFTSSRPFPPARNIQDVALSRPQPPLRLDPRARPPTIEALAANDRLRDHSLRRFERDDPPPYTSSTESEDFDHDAFFAQQQPQQQQQGLGHVVDDVQDAPPELPEELPEELQAIMEPPITEQEAKNIATDLARLLRPRHVYWVHSRAEEHRVHQWPRPTNDLFHQRKGIQRCAVVVRHNIRRRWEELGVWNPRWGFAGRKLRPSDDARRWQWPWEPQRPNDARSAYLSDAYYEELMTRALRLRQNLRRGETAPVVPRSLLEPFDSPSHPESFLISRPWVIFQTEVAEESKRYLRIPLEQRRRYPHAPREQVIKWWKERGDWRDEFDKDVGYYVGDVVESMNAWKWRHESPSPEPEDLTPIDAHWKRPLVETSIDFSLSEVEDLETIELPDHEKTEWYWTVDLLDERPLFPGQTGNPAAERARRLAMLLPTGSPPLHRQATVDLFAAAIPLPGEEGSKAPAEEHSSDLQAPREEAPANPPPQGRRRRRVSQPGRLSSAGIQIEVQPQPSPRRSARIAAMKRPAESAPSQAAEAPNKRRRVANPPKTAPSAAPEPTARARQGRPKKARPVPARPPPKVETQARPKRASSTGAAAPKGVGKRTKPPRSTVAKKAAQTPPPAKRLLRTRR